MKWELLTPVVDVFQKMFQNTMKELFANKCLCEEASLYFFVVEILNDSKRVFYINPAGEINDISENGEETVNGLIHKSMKERIKDGKYMQMISDSVEIGGQKCKIAWIIASECMDHNRGRFLFRCVCEALADAFNGMLRQTDYVCESDVIRQITAWWTDEEQHFIQASIQEAADKVSLYLQTLYAPLNLSFIVKLSGEYYERAACRSNMVLLSQNAACSIRKTDFVYCLDNTKSDEMKLDDIFFVPAQMRLIRKLLQIAQQDLCLVLGEDADRHIFKVLGICKKSLFHEKNRQISHVMIRFKNHMQWDMLLNEIYMFSYKNGQYIIEDKTDDRNIVTQIREYFGECEENCRNSAAAISEAVQQEHGTMIILMRAEEARREARRLGEMQYGLPAVVPEILTDNIRQLSNIDGSVIMDTSGRIYGIGMILDGVGQAPGNLARGARYNSVVKYREELRKRNMKAMFFIISEDKTVDLLVC